jgi:predicted MFS family arabinose efflux permease
MIARMKSTLAGKKLSRDFWTFFAAALCFDFGASMYFFLFNLFLLDRGFAVRQVGHIVSAITIGGMIGTIPVGLLARRVGLQRLLLSGFVLSPVVLALRLAANGEVMQIALAIATGGCFCLWSVCFSPAAARLTTEENRTFAFSLLFSTGIAMGIVGGLVGGWLPGWIQTAAHASSAAAAKRIVLLLCCAIMAAGAWPLSRLRMGVEQARPRGPWRPPPFLLRFLPAVALWSIVLGAFTPFATVYLSRQVGLPLQANGMIFAASNLAQVCAVLLAPSLFRRLGLVRGIVCTQVATAVALASLAITHRSSEAVAVYLGFTAMQWMSSPGIYSLLMNRVSESERSGASAAHVFVGSLSQAVASAAAGGAFERFGYPAVLAAIALIALAAAALFHALLSTRHDAAICVPATAQC